MPRIFRRRAAGSSLNPNRFPIAMSDIVPSKASISAVQTIAFLFSIELLHHGMRNLNAALLVRGDRTKARGTTCRHRRFRQASRCQSEPGRFLIAGGLPVAARLSKLGHTVGNASVANGRR